MKTSGTLFSRCVLAHCSLQAPVDDQITRLINLTDLCSDLGLILSAGLAQMPDHKYCQKLRQDINELQIDLASLMRKAGGEGSALLGGGKTVIWLPNVRFCYGFEDFCETGLL